MKLKDLKPVLSADGVNLYIETGKAITFRREDCTEDSEYYCNADSENNGVNMWDKYGEFEIEQLYNNSWSDINIDINYIK